VVSALWLFAFAIAKVNPISGGNSNSDDYPNDPINQSELTWLANGGPVLPPEKGIYVL